MKKNSLYIHWESGKKRLERFYIKSKERAQEFLKGKKFGKAEYYDNNGEMTVFEPKL